MMKNGWYFTSCYDNICKIRPSRTSYFVIYCTCSSNVEKHNPQNYFSVDLNKLDPLGDFHCPEIFVKIHMFVSISGRKG